MAKQVKINRDNIAKLFDEKEHQAEIIVDLYKMVMDDFDQRESIEIFPKCNESLWNFICDQFITFDKKFHKGVMAGGAWLSKGFSADKSLADNVVEVY